MCFWTILQLGAQESGLKRGGGGWGRGLIWAYLWLVSLLPSLLSVYVCILVVPRLFATFHLFIIILHIVFGNFPWQRSSGPYFALCLLSASAFFFSTFWGGTFYKQVSLSRFRLLQRLVNENEKCFNTHHPRNETRMGVNRIKGGGFGEGLAKTMRTGRTSQSSLHNLKTFPTVPLLHSSLHSLCLSFSRSTSSLATTLSRHRKLNYNEGTREIKDVHWAKIVGNLKAQERKHCNLKSRKTKYCIKQSLINIS